MLNVTICGLGNAGSQVAASAVENLNIKGMCINTSGKDLDQVKSANIKKVLVGDANGSGKERSLATLSKLSPIASSKVSPKTSK